MDLGLRWKMLDAQGKMYNKEDEEYNSKSI